MLQRFFKFELIKGKRFNVKNEIIKTDKGKIQIKALMLFSLLLDSLSPVRIEGNNEIISIMRFAQGFNNPPLPVKQKDNKLNRKENNAKNIPKLTVNILTLKQLFLSVIVNLLKLITYYKIP